MCIRCIRKNEEDDGSTSSSFLLDEIEGAINSQHKYWNESNEILDEIRNTVLSMPDEPTTAWVYDLFMLSTKAIGKRRFAEACEQFVERRMNQLIDDE